MRKKLNKKEVARILHLQRKILELRDIIESNDVPLQMNSGTASEHLDCASASLETILQEYD